MKIKTAYDFDAWRKKAEKQYEDNFPKIKEGISRAKIAREYNVGKTTITDIATLKSWEYISRP